MTAALVTAAAAPASTPPATIPTRTAELRRGDTILIGRRMFHVKHASRRDKGTVGLELQLVNAVKPRMRTRFLVLRAQITVGKVVP